MALLLGMTTCSVFAAEDSDEESREKQRKKNELKIKQDEQDLISAQFSYGFDDISDHLVLINCESDLGKSSGSGFIAKMGDKFYIVTNQHVILGADKISFKTASGKTLKPRRIELAMNRDVARLELNTDSGFVLSNVVQMDIPVAVFGNSEGAGVATELYGTVNGIGAELIETSAEFVSGNSGSPILNLNGEVLGIVTYVRISRGSAMKEGTKFENKTRRFCYRLNGIEWKGVKWKQYNDKYGKLYRQSEQLTEGIYEIIISWGGAPLAKINIEDNPERTLTSWAKSHNEVIGKHNRSGNKSRAFATDYSNSLKKLSGVCKNRARQIGMFSNQRDLTGFLRDEFEQQSNALDYLAKVINQISDTAYVLR